jgi:hypothetical protein|tara:strand:- start:2235 stop:2573 length:339 start_codon:yes stop_codon:yes gene_type:complete
MVLYVDHILTFAPKDSSLYNDWKESSGTRYVYTECKNVHNTVVRYRPQEEESVASEDDLEDAVQDEEEHSDHPEDGCGQSDAYSESADMPSPGSTRPRSKDRRTRSNTTLDD